jgi:DNA-binding CsgD family transcriptional regulator
LQITAQQDTGTDQEGWAGVWLASEPTPRVVVDIGLNVLWRNNAADSFLRRSPLLHHRDGALGSTDRRISNQLQSLTWNVKPGRPTSAVVGRPDDGALLLTGVPLDGSPGSGVGLTIREIEVDTRYELPDLEPIFGLTPSEQQIVGLLLAGLSSAEIATKLDKSILTIRTHVKHAYAKLGISSKEQLFAKLLRYGVVW